MIQDALALVVFTLLLVTFVAEMVKLWKEEM